MGGPDNSVNNAGIFCQDGGQCRDRCFQALARAEQPEGHQHRAVFQIKQTLEFLLPSEWPVRRAMFDQGQQIMRSAIIFRQQVARMARHRHDARCAFDQPGQDAFLAFGGFGQDGMGRQDKRRGQLFHKVEDHCAIVATEDAVFVLQPDGIVPARIDCPRRLPVTFRIVAGDRARAVAILMRLGAVVQCKHVHIDFGMVHPQIFGDVTRKRSDAAFARRERADQRHAKHAACRTRKIQDGSAVVRGGMIGRAGWDSRHRQVPSCSLFRADSPSGWNVAVQHQ